MRELHARLAAAGLAVPPEREWRAALERTGGARAIGAAAWIGAAAIAAGLVLVTRGAGLDGFVPSVLAGGALLAWALPGHSFRPPWTALRRPLGYALAVALAAWLVPLSAAPEAARGTGAAAAAVLFGVAGARVFARLRIPLSTRPGTLAFLGGAAIAGVGTAVPGVTAGHGLMALGVESREPALFAVGALGGLAALLLWTAGQPPLAGAAALAGAGLFLLALRFAARRSSR